MADSPRVTNEAGAALVAALMVTMLLTTLSAALTFMMVTETMTSANYRTARQTLFAAEAGIERTISDLRGLEDWSQVLAPPPGNVTSGFDDGSVKPSSADGTSLDLAALGAGLQAASEATHGSPASNPNSPAWRLFAHASAGTLIPGEPAQALPYVIVWVADDPGDADAEPSHDSNGVVLLHAEAYGISGARRIVEATVAHDVARGLPAPVRLLAWRDVR